MSDIIPTRMELLKLKGRISLAKKGHNLLKQKRDALILEFFKILKKSKNLRVELNELMGSAYKSMYLAQLYHSNVELENVALNCRREIPIEMEVTNIMGVKIPQIDVENIDLKPVVERGYSVAGTSAKIDDSVSKFGKALELIMKIAETETAIRRLVLEIEKTKRRVNSLEYIILPKLSSQAKSIVLRLDEMERDAFVSLKTIKKKLEKEAKAKHN